MSVEPIASESFSKVILKSLLEERRSDRFWKNFRFFGWILILLLYIFIIFFLSSDRKDTQNANAPYVASLQLNGLISADTNFSAKIVIPELQQAFADSKSKGVLLIVNSPGGSPVQASLIHDKILELKKQYKKKVVVVGEDTLASGAYLVATAADKIYVNPDTLTGSIGVVMGGFGFVDTLKKLGITRRVFTAGTHKDRLDPFSQLDEQDVVKIKHVLHQVHQHFIQDVLDGRGDRLQGNRSELFSGDFWTGDVAMQLGIVDGTKDVWTVLKEEFNVKYYKDYTIKPSLLKQLIQHTSTALSLYLYKRVSPIQEVAY